MGSPITGSNFDISNFSGEVCEAITKLLQVNANLKTWFTWAFTSDGSQITPEFAALFSTFLYPIGAPIWWPMASVPANCVQADGRSLLRAHTSATNLNGYPELFAVYGTQYGFEDSTHFNVIDLREVFLFGSGNSHSVGEEGGEESHVLVASELPKHSLNVSFQLEDAANNNYSASGKILGPVATTADKVIATSEIGSNSAHQNMPPYRVGLWVVKAK